MATHKLTSADLAQFTGTTTWYRHGLKRDVVYTDGIQFLAERGEAYWLVDAIVSYLGSKTLTKAIEADGRLGDIQFWTLEVAEDNSATLTCRADKGVLPAITQDIPFTDFPLKTVTVYVGRSDGYWVLYLPSEH